MRAAIILTLQNRTLCNNGLKANNHTGSFCKRISRSLNGTSAFASSTIATTNAVVWISNTTDSSSRSDLVNQSIYFSNNGNKKTTTNLFGTVIGISSAIVIGGGLYSKHQKDSNQIQNVNRVQFENDTNISQQQLKVTVSDTTALIIDNDVDKQLVVPLKEHHQPEQQQQHVEYRTGNMMTLLSTSPNVVDSVDNDTCTDTEFVDEYDNLPETDEPTTCFFCLIYRQGPCRTVFRKYYQCSQDNKENEVGKKKCLPYFKNFIECEESYIELYELVEMSLYQEYIDSIEQDITEVERRCWPSSSSISTGDTTTGTSTIHMDWGDWPKFVSKKGLNYTQVNNNTDTTLPLWKRFPEGVNPTLLSGKASIPNTINENNNNKQQTDFILKEVWVTDQDGMLLGYSRNKKFGALDNDDDDKNNDNNTKEESDDSSSCTCVFQIIPGLTKQVTVHGKYLKNSSVAKEEPEVLVYSSKPYCMEKAATK